MAGEVITVLGSIEGNVVLMVTPITASGVVWYLMFISYECFRPVCVPFVSVTQADGETVWEGQDKLDATFSCH